MSGTGPSNGLRILSEREGLGVPTGVGWKCFAPSDMKISLSVIRVRVSSYQPTVTNNVNAALR